MANDSFRKAIELANSNKKFPVISLVRENPELAAALSKLVAPTETPAYDTQGNRSITEPNTYNFRNTSDTISQNINDANTVLQVLPETDLPIQILISSVLAPKDMVTTELTYSVPEGMFQPNVSSALLLIIRKYFEHDYKIKQLLPKMLRDMLANTGSYPVAVIPENSIDEVINGNVNVNMESISNNINTDGVFKPIGILGPSGDGVDKSDVISLETFSSYSFSGVSVDQKINFSSNNNTESISSYTSVTDNPSALKMPLLATKARELRIRSLINSKALESFSDNKFTDRAISNVMYKNRGSSYKSITTLKTQEQLNRKTVGNPLILHLPSEAVIPVHVPGRVEQQLGIFVLLDIDGHPLTRVNDSDYYQQLTNRLNNTGSFATAMLNKVKSQMDGFNPANREHLNYSAKVYGDMIEKDLLSRLRNGVYGNGVALAKNEEIYRIMLARTLAKQHSQLLYLPIELCTYMAFDYTDDGIGTSVLDSMKILNSLRSMLMFANVMAALKNSVGRTNVKIKLDPDDPNAKKSIETTMHETINARTQSFPLGRNNPIDLTDWLQRAGFDFTYEGHPDLPDIAIDYTEKNTNYTKPDTDLEEGLRKKSIMSWGISPETVDASNQADFATSIVNSNVLLSKRVVQIQEKFTPQLSDHMRKVIMHSERVVDDLRDILIKNVDKLVLEEEDADNPSNDAEIKETNKKKDYSEEEKNAIVNRALNDFILNFEVELPKPNSVTLENQVASLETYLKALDLTIDAWVSDKFFNVDLGGDVANQVMSVKEVLRAYFIRKWLAENGVMPELSALTNVTDDGEPELDIYKIQQEHISALTRSFTRFMSGLQKDKNASNEKIEKMGGVSEEPEPSQSEPVGGSSDGDFISNLPEMPTDAGSNFDSLPGETETAINNGNGETSPTNGKEATGDNNEDGEKTPDNDEIIPDGS